MKSVGVYLREARLNKNFSISHLEGITKIKREFIEAIERQQWEKLPAFSVVTGFVKNISKALELDEKQVTAFLRRDYPPQEVRISPKPDVSTKFFWTPKLTFIVGILIVFSVILGYLGYEYINFISPPKLEVTSPKEGQTVTRQFFNVEGSVNGGATITVNNQQATVGNDGKFESQIEVSKDLKEVKVVATSRSGKTTEVHRTIKVELK